MRHHADFLAERDYIRPGVSVAEAIDDILWACSSTEFDELLVIQRACPLLRFAQSSPTS